MGMGLSPLQKTILRIGAENESRYMQPWQVKVFFYGFPLRSKRNSFGSLGQLRFNRRVIGAKKYRAASVSIAKSFDRLVKRGLAERYYGYGVTLTARGLALAKKLKEAP